MLNLNLMEDAFLNSESAQRSLPHAYLCTRWKNATSASS